MDDLVPEHSGPALDEGPPAPPNRDLRLARVAVSLAFLINGAGIATWVSRIPVIRHELALTDTQLGIALFGLGFGALIGFPLSSLVCAKFGSRFATVGFGLFFCSFLPLIPYANSLTSLIVILGLFGLAQGAMDVSMNMNGVEVENRYGRSIMSALHGNWSLGGFIGAGIGLILANREVTPAWHFLGVGIVLTALTIFCAFKMLWIKPLGRTNEPVFAIPPKSLLAVGTIVTCAFLAEACVGDWSGVYFKDTLKTSADFAVAGYVVYALMMTLARFSGDIVISQWGPVRTMRVFGSLATFGFALALLGFHPVLAVVGFACVGLGLSTIVPIGFSAAGRTPGIASGTAIAAVATMGYAGFLVGPPIIGFLADHISLRWTLCLVGLLTLAIVGLAKSVGNKDAPTRRV